MIFSINKFPPPPPPTAPKVITGDGSDAWELRVCILLSLFLQIFLSVGGTFRRFASHKWIAILLWLAYLLAEIIAIFALGLIVSRQRLFAEYCKDMDNTSHKKYCYQDFFHIFWAPFLLVHLGGPDTITAFAPEDNELWPRHVIYLLSQCTAVAYCFYESLQFGNHAKFPTVSMLLCGIIKCTERIAALYYGSANSFRNSMLSKSDVDAKTKRKKSKLLIKKNGETLSHLQLLQNAFVYFTAFKGLVVDLILSIHERNQSQEFFLATSCKDAFRLVEVELNYLYDILFTKIPVLHHKVGYCCRALSFLLLVASLIYYTNNHYFNDGHEYMPSEVCFTFILLTGAIMLEVIAFYSLLVSDWTVIKLKPLSEANANSKSWKDKFLNFIIFVNITRSRFLHWFLLVVGLKDFRHGSEFTDSRWANSLSTFNLLYYCLHRRSEGWENFYNNVGLVSFLDEVWYVKQQSLTHYITGFIFEELTMKSVKAGRDLAIAKEICLSKGEWVLQEMGEGHVTFLPFVVNYNYDDILLLWHIATELCYNDIHDPLIGNEQRETAKKLSDYMLYLVVIKPEMMSGVSGIGEIKFRETCSVISKFFDKNLPELQKRNFFDFFHRESTEKNEGLKRKACEIILHKNSQVELVSSQLRDERIFLTASVLAKKLKVLPSETKWLTISKLWVELLSYAASHIRSSAHAVQLSRGGELITIVWLLMAHFGLGDQYEINPWKQASITIN